MSATSASPPGRRPARVGGYLPIGDYAAIGDGHTVALVGLDGSIDWMCLPRFDSPFVFGALLDSDRGGRFALEPTAPYDASRIYLPHTNVLQTTFHTEKGVARVTDALTIQPAGRQVRELVRSVEGVAGEVGMGWCFAPRFGGVRRPATIRREEGRLVAVRDGDGVAIQAWDAGDPRVADDAVNARFALAAGERATIVMSATSIADGPLPLVSRADAEQRLARTVDWWRDWCEGCGYDGPWRDAVLRSGLVLKMLVDRGTGAVIAAPTTGLPEALGGSRNWDYRYSWLRDSSFAVDALMQLGDVEEAHRFFTWVANATRARHPTLQPFYRLDGSSEIAEAQADALAGYRDSEPVRLGNGAVAQRQLGNYGDVMQAAALYAEGGRDFEPDVARRLAELADEVCEEWHHRDSGVWELNEDLHYTQSKMLCWVALDRAGKLAHEQKIPGESAARWRETAERIHGFVEERCWSSELGSYARSADGDELDAGVLLAVFMGYEGTRDRFNATVDRLQQQLGVGPLLYRYTGMPGAEGAFLACSFWRAHALVRLGRLAESEALIDELVGLANDVGLYAEEMDPASGAMLGNFPQALTHLSLVNAIMTLAQRRQER